MTTYRLQSSAALYAPGLIAWAINGAHFKHDRPIIINIVSQTWNLPEPTARKLVTKQVTYTIDGETVVFEA